VEKENQIVGHDFLYYLFTSEALNKISVNKPSLLQR
jgi:hypothetical protein